MIKKTLFERFKKGFNSFAVLTLLLPNLMSVGVVAAEEITAEEPETEEVEEVDVEEEVLDETPPAPEPEEPVAEEVTEEEIVEEEVVEEEPIEENTPEEEATPVEEPVAIAEEEVEEAEPAQVTGIVQENLVYENGLLTLHNQIEGTGIAAVLPNGSLINTQVPFHGRWSPRQNLARNKIYVGDEIEFFTYSGTDLGESIFLTVEGEGETRPADEYAIQYSRQHFGFLPTERSTNITYRTEPFFIVEMTLPNGAVETKRSSSLGQVRFDFAENNYTTGPGHVFSVRVFDRNNNLIDLRDSNLFIDPSRNQIETRIPGDPIPATRTVTIDSNGGTIDEALQVTEVEDGATYTLPSARNLSLERTGYSLAGYSVEGTLLNANGEAVTEITRFTNTYTPVTDVTLTANWEVTTGDFSLSITNTDIEPEDYRLELVDEDGNPQELPFKHVTTSAGVPIAYVWGDEAFPYGTYTLSIEGYEITRASIRGWQIGTDPVMNEDGSVTFVLDFQPNYSANHATLSLDVEPIPSAHTVSIDPNGGTIDEAYAATEINEGETYTLPYNFQSNLARPGYTLTGYTVEGTLLDANGNEVTEIPRFTNVYTPMSDVTLTANWEITNGGFRVVLYDENPATQTDRYSVTLIAEDGSEYELSSRSYNRDSRTWTIDGVPNGTYTLVVDGFTISEGEKYGQPDTTSNFELNEDGTATVELEFVDDKTTTFIRYRVYGDPIPSTYNVTIDPNGGTINEAYATTEINAGETYTVPYTFQSNLARPGYTLTGYTVEGTLLDANGNEVTELSRYTGIYTPMSDVTLTANWEISSGGFRIHDRIDGFITEDRSFALTDGENTYPLTSNSYTNQYRIWRVEDVPNGVYTLLVDGVEYPNEWNLNTTNPNSSATIADDGTVTVDLTFVDDSTSTFVRFELTMNEYEVGVEVRDLDNRRTSDVGIRIENEAGTVFEGSYDQYNLWTSDATVLPGNYTITLDTPDGTFAEINETVASQVAEPTDEPNVFTIAVNRETKGNLSRVFGAFRLVEEEVETHPLGIEVRDLNGRRTSDVTVFVQNEDLVVFSGSFNQYAQWISDEELPVGEYTITLRTPENTYAVVQDTTHQHAVPTDRENVFTIEINEENRGNLSRVFAAFELVEMEFRLGVEVRGLDGRRTNDVGVVVTNEDDEIFAGSYNAYLQWITEEDLPAGEYSITLTTPEGTVAEINDIASNYAVPTEEENVFTIQLNEANLGSSSTIYGDFRLVEVPVEPVETYEDITTNEPIAYETETRNNPNLPRGERRVVQVGVEGTRSVTERVYYEDGVEVRREIIDETTTPAVKEIIEIGTKTSIGTIVRKVVSVVVKVVKSIFSWFF